jgi:hypothetical protein
MFGYIHHKPNIITTYTVTGDSLAQPNKSYYREYVEKGEVQYEDLTEHYKLLKGDDFGSNPLNFYY